MLLLAGSHVIRRARDARRILVDQQLSHMGSKGRTCVDEGPLIACKGFHSKAVAVTWIYCGSHESNAAGP
jgi:hypothetical protein